MPLHGETARLPRALWHDAIGFAVDSERSNVQCVGGRLAASFFGRDYAARAACANRLALRYDSAICERPEVTRSIGRPPSVKRFAQTPAFALGLRLPRLVIVEHVVWPDFGQRRSQAAPSRPESAEIEPKLGSPRTPGSLDSLRDTWPAAARERSGNLVLSASIGWGPPRGCASGS